MQKQQSKIIIGRLEKIDFPELSVCDLDAKIDTGAFTSSLHCHKVKVEDRNYKKRVQFYLFDPDHPEYEEKVFTSRVHKIKKVRSSNGLMEERVIIQQKVVFGGEEYVMELSLADRSEMKYPVLLGRKFLQDRYLVDVSEKYKLQK